MKNKLKKNEKKIKINKKKIKNDVYDYKLKKQIS